MFTSLSTHIQLLKQLTWIWRRLALIWGRKLQSLRIKVLLLILWFTCHPLCLKKIWILTIKKTIDNFYTLINMFYLVINNWFYFLVSCLLCCSLLTRCRRTVLRWSRTSIKTISMSSITSISVVILKLYSLRPVNAKINISFSHFQFPNSLSHNCQ